MGKKFSELRFEEWIEQSLLNKGYHSSFTHSGEHESRYNKDLCLVEDEVISFIKSTQSDEYEKLYNQFEESTDSHLFKKIYETISSRGIIETLRSGFSTRGCSFNLLYFKPKSSLNKEHTELYGKNRFLVVRQLHYSTRNRNSLDMVLFLNGIPIITMELKNQLSGQSIEDSQKQYRKDRDPKETLFQFKRCLVHFCVDNDKVSMTTELKGEKTRFLPYNKGITNPIVPDDYRSEYLWNEILTPDSVLDIIENFVLLSQESDKEWSNEKKMVVEKKFDVLIFPRYHQLEVIRNLRNKVKEEGVGHNYLIQHTTGSGKSYSIGYLSHTLTSLYQRDGDTKRMFDSILVITDRKVLDKQLQGTISKLEQTGGVVNPVDLTSKQLMEFLEKGKDIIITTIQKFPVISDTISQLKSKTFAVIIDEVHSSQSGETSKHLKKSLSKSQHEEDGDDDDDGERDYEDMIREEIQSRGKQSHISFFGFTGTPKNKTLELFGRKNEQGQFLPFHTYTMKQSILEGFTLDVLQNYTTYKRYFKITQKSDDKELPESQVKKELVQYTDSHPETIRKKVSIILEHFTNKTSKTIGGRGRGMVVVRARYHCVLFQQEMKKQMKEMGLPYSCLVAFSGSIKYNGSEHTESSLNTDNGMSGNIPDGFKDPRYRILIVSNKYQTGFDEVLVQSMFVDKKLNGVQCVQTLSRLNRTTTGKTDTFVLDFVNDTEDILESFQPFYTTTLLTGETDPDKLYDLVYQIEEYNLFTKHQLDEFCKEYYRDTTSDQRIQPILNEVVDRYNERLNDEEKEKFKSLIQTYIRQYSYISQISSFTEVHWEKVYVFVRSLNKKLPKGKDDRVSVLDSVNLDSLRIQMIGTTSIQLEDKTGELEPISNESGKGKQEEPLELLSQIIQKVNETYGTGFKSEDHITLGNVFQNVSSNPELLKVMEGNNSEDVKKEEFGRVFKEEMVDYHGDRIDFYKMVMDKKVLNYIIDSLYHQFNQGRVL